MSEETLDDLMGVPQEVEGGTKTVSVGITKTVNTGNYESLKIYVGVSESVPMAAPIQGEIDRVWEECKKALAKRVKKVTQNVA